MIAFTLAHLRSLCKIKLAVRYDSNSIFLSNLAWVVLETAASLMSPCLRSNCLTLFLALLVDQATIPLTLQVTSGPRDQLRSAKPQAISSARALMSCNFPRCQPEIQCSPQPSIYQSQSEPCADSGVHQHQVRCSSTPGVHQRQVRCSSTQAFINAKSGVHQRQVRCSSTPGVHQRQVRCSSTPGVHTHQPRRS